jgi:hypothetical protein
MRQRVLVVGCSMVLAVLARVVSAQCPCERALDDGLRETVHATQDTDLKIELTRLLRMSSEELHRESQQKSISGSLAAALEENRASAEINSTNKREKITSAQRFLSDNVDLQLNQHHYQQVVTSLVNVEVAKAYFECVKEKCSETRGGLTVHLEEIPGTAFAELEVSFVAPYPAISHLQTIETIDVFGAKDFDASKFAVTNGSEVGFQGLVGRLQRMEGHPLFVSVTLKNGMGSDGSSLPRFEVISPPPPRPRDATFIVEVKTKRDPDGHRGRNPQSDGEIHVQMYGNLGQTPRLRLNNLKHDDFQSGHTDQFRLETHKNRRLKEVGVLSRLEFRGIGQVKNFDDWQCEGGTITVIFGDKIDVYTIPAFQVGDDNGRVRTVNLQKVDGKNEFKLIRK